MKKNLLFKAGIKTLSIFVFAFAILFSFQQAKAQTISNNQTGTQDGWYWSFWKDNGSASMTLYPGGRYTTTWNGVNNFTAGKGWAVGSPTREICFSGSFNGGNNGYLAVYGWTKNALIEYYVVENYGSWTPPGGTSKGTFTSDGGTYNIYETTRTNQPSIIGTATFQQYWSVRTTKRSSGTVTFANHVAAWKAKGMNMGTTWDYQIIETEGYQSTGSSDITISDCGTVCATVAPTVTSPVSYVQNATATALTASGTALKWYGTSATGGTASTSAPTPSTATVGSTTYYVSQTLNNCEGPRAAIVVTVTASTGGCTTAAPTVTSPVSYVQNATATALNATGTALKWYGTSATGGTSSSTAPTPSTATVGTTSYYVSQTLNNCEGPRAAIVVNVTSAGSTGTGCTEAGSGAFHTNVYRNMFKELLNKTDAEVKTKIDAAFQQIFYGNTSQQLYYPVGTDMAYILDVANNDVRTEGMSYGMMICVQLDKQAEFDKIWKWAKTKMQRSDGFFNWQLNTNGTVKGSGPASDGEAYFITSLLFASNRWGNGTGINNYGAEAQDILKRVMAMGGNSNLFNANSKLITFVPSGDSYNYTDPSYNLPGFFECWKRWSTTNTSFWAQTPDAARKLLRDASNSTSGLYADYSNFDGTPKTTSFNSDSHRFMYDAWRSIMNLGMDYHWFKTDALQPAVAERYLTFFKNQGANYKNHYDWNGSNAGGDHSTGLVACNAVASFATTNTALSTPFVQELWNVAIPSGTYRYYDGMLYMLGLLNCSGNFKAWKPTCTITEVQEDAKSTETFKVYPNPFVSQVSVDANGAFEYALLSSSGELLLSGTSENKIELGNDLAQGVYFLKIKQAGSSKVVKICKN